MYSLLKPGFDFLFSLILIILLLPVMLIISILIKLESTGPIFFKQNRIGINGQQFQIYKFRSMKIDTPNVATDKLNNPQMYITRTGKVLRKTSLDELPQLINIFRGEMSFIGPRPALYNQYELTEKRRQAGVDVVKPGLTGYAQIKGRDNISDKEKVECDLYYVQHCSLLLDLKIIYWTFINVVKAENIRS